MAEIMEVQETPERKSRDTNKVIQEARHWINSIKAASKPSLCTTENGNVSEGSVSKGSSSQFQFFDYEWMVSNVNSDEIKSETSLLDKRPESNTIPIDINFHVEKSEDGKELILKIIVSYKGQPIYGLCSVHFTFFDEKTLPHPVVPVCTASQNVDGCVKYVIKKVLSDSLLQKLKEKALHPGNKFKIFCTITLCPFKKQTNGNKNLDH